MGSDSKSYLEIELTDHGGPSDAKDNCPHDGDAGTGNDNKGPGGGCKPPRGQYGKACNKPGQGRPKNCP